jgi:hypothetical protein
MTKIIAVCLLAAAVGAAWVQRNSIAALREKNVELRQQAAEAESAARENRGAPQPVDDQEIQSLTETTKELPKLRNEVRQLRQQKPELDKLQAENRELAAALKAAPKTTARRMTEAEGFVLREKWAHAGFATPEATVQTFFWALANKDLRAWAQCISGKDGLKMEQEIRESADGGAKRMETKFAEVANIQGFRIAERKQIAEDKVELGLQAATGGQMLLMRLQLVDGEWKLTN